MRDERAAAAWWTTWVMPCSGGTIAKGSGEDDLVVDVVM